MGAYPTGQTAGNLEQQDPRFLYALESDITHPTHTDGFVDAGDVVIAGNITGVCLNSAAAATDKVVIDTGGIYHLSVTRADEAGNVAIAFGDAIFVATDATLSKKQTGRFFGFAMAASVVGDGSAVVLPIWLGSMNNNPDEIVAVPFGPLAAADVAKQIFLADRPCRLLMAKARWGTKAGQAGSLTIEKCTAGEAAAAGDVALAAAFDLTADNDTTVSKLAVADGKEVMAAGDALRLKLASGAATSLADMIGTLLIQYNL